MGKKSKRTENDLEAFDDDISPDVDIDNLIAEIHSAESWEPSVSHRKRSARRRLEDLEYRRALRRSLADWDDFDDREYRNAHY